MTNEPLCVLVQESLAQIGVKVTLNKIPGANWRAEFSKKSLPFLANAFGGWLNFPEYFFYWTYHGQNAIFNTMSYQNPAMDKLIDAARFETDPQKYKEESRALSTSPSTRCRASRCSSRLSTWRCRRTSPATATGSTASSITGSWRRRNCTSGGDRDGVIFDMRRESNAPQAPLASAAVPQAPSQSASARWHGVLGRDVCRTLADDR